MKLSIFGTGYVGLVTGACMVSMVTAADGFVRRDGQAA